MSDDQDDFEVALWLAMMCCCDRCEDMLWLDELQELWESDLIKWSEVVAAEARRRGWRYHDGHVECDKCRLKHGLAEAGNRPID